VEHKKKDDVKVVPVASSTFDRVLSWSEEQVFNYFKVLDMPEVADHLLDMGCHGEMLLSFDSGMVKEIDLDPRDWKRFQEVLDQLHRVPGPFEYNPWHLAIGKIT
jgi:hypothetical protein